MNYRTLTYERVELPLVGGSLANIEVAPPRLKTTCPICRNPRRDAIEALMFTGMSVKDQHAQARAMGCRVSFDQYRKHMAEHQATAITENASAVLAHVGNPLSTEGLSKLLLADALSGILRGDIQIDSVKDLALVMSTLDKREQYEYERMVAQSHGAESIDDAYRQLTAIMEAASEVMSEEQLRSFVLSAWQKGLDKNIVEIVEVPIYQPSEGYEEQDMSGALDKYRND